MFCRLEPMKKTTQTSTGAVSDNTKTEVKKCAGLKQLPLEIPIK